MGMCLHIANNVSSMKLLVDVLCSAKNVLRKRQAVRNRGSNHRCASTVRKQNPNEYCMDLVRRCDYENFLSTLLLPSDVRAAAFVIRAFNVEIAQVKDMVSNKTIGQMRMQFWNQSIDEIFLGNPPHQPVALALAKILHSKNLSKHWFKRMVECRAEKLADQPFTSVAELEQYSEKSTSSVYYLILESIGLKSVHADHVASHVGKAQGVTNLIRSVTFNAGNGKVYLPNDIMIQYKVSQEDILRGAKEASLKDVIHGIASVAYQHIEKARSLRNNLPSEAVVIFLPLAATDQYLKALQKVDFNVFHSALQKKNSWLPLLLCWNTIKMTY